MHSSASAFQDMIKQYYHVHKRSLPWRENITPYHVTVSEIMLQQTQVSRVLQKYPEFIERFPSFAALAQADLKNILHTWQGMGYNRRALYLRSIAQNIIHQYNGILPKDPTILDTFPGIGKATACAIVTYTYNIPTVFIETNIRRVFLHHFFSHKENVRDSDIYPLVEKTLDTKNPRDWYYALMDYSTFLAKTQENANKKSKHYQKQSKFEGSTRQIRSAVLKLLLQHQLLSKDELREHISDERLDSVLESLIKDTLLKQQDSTYFLAG